MCFLHCQIILSILKDKVKQEEGKWSTKGKNSVSWWKENKLVLTHPSYMPVSFKSSLTKQMHAESKGMTRERSAWAEMAKGTDPPQLPVTVAAGWMQTHKQGLPCCLGHSWTYFCPLCCTLSQQKDKELLLSWKCFLMEYHAKVFADPVYALLICAVWWSGTISVVKSKFHHFQTETTKDLHLDEESSPSQSHNGASHVNEKFRRKLEVLQCTFFLLHDVSVYSTPGRI